MHPDTDVVTPTDPDAADAADLGELESVIRDGLGGFVRVGSALKAIRDRRLYRATHATFEDYCRERWGFARSFANKMVRAADVVGILGTIVPKPPLLESHARALVRLKDADEQAGAWRASLERVGGDVARVTAAVVREEVAKYLPAEPDRPFDFVRERSAVFGWLADRLEAWPAEYRDTFAEFVSKIAADIQEQQRAD